MSKLLIKPKPGYTDAKASSNSGSYPNTLVEAIYWDEEQISLEETLRRLQEGGGGGSELKIINGSMWLMARKDAINTNQLTKAEAMEYLHISEDEFDLLVDSVGVYNFDVLEHFCVVRVGGSFYFPSFKQSNDFSVTCLYIPVEQDNECVIRRVDIVPHYQAGSSDSDLRYDIYGLARAPM